MKMKKKLYSIMVAVFTSLLVLLLGSNVYAATDTTKFGIRRFRELQSDGLQYSYQLRSPIVWKVVKYDNNGTTYNYDNTIYCLKAGKGFYTPDTGVFIQDYNASYNFRDKANLPNLPTELNDEATYKSILWLLDNAYIQKASTAAKDKQALFEAAGLTEDYYRELTEDDIDVVQQAAIWYFTNPEDSDYHSGEIPELNTIGIASKIESAPDVQVPTYQAMSRVNEMRNDAMQDLFKYLVNTAKQAATGNIYNQNNQYKMVPPIALAATNPTAVEQGSNYVIGPYKINKNSDTPYTLEAKFTDQDNQDISGKYTLLDENKAAVATGTTIKDLVGKNFYISIPSSQTSITKVNFSINGSSYRDSSLTYWTNSSNSMVQPLVEVKKQDNPITGSNSVNIIRQKFDLSLRKFISQVGDQTVNRAPTVDTSKLNTIVDGLEVTTATYNHTKLPIAVKTGDIVTYTIRVYNEGEKDGYAQEVTDYLPEELEFLNNDFNASYGWTIDRDNLRRIKTNYLAYSSNAADADKNAANLLKAYDSATGTLDYKELKVQCKVKETAAAKKQITNLAQITDCKDSNGNAVVDRDSTPNGGFTLPTDETLPAYKDEEIRSGVEYIPGQEDDDDFEKIIVQEFDLALRKFITGVNTVELIGRDPVVDVTNLANGTAKTAIYNHTKKPLDVKRGDVITYTIRVYNEAEISGYATKITDYLPEELEFLPDDTLNKEYEWTLAADGRTISTDYLSKAKETTERQNLINYFDGTTLSYKDVKVNVKVKQTAEFAKKLTNLAEITDCKDEDGNDVVDRDSQPSNVVLPTDKDLPAYKDTEIDRGDKYIPGQQDDDDFEKVRVVYFDLALRKFITAVNDTQVTNRIPEVSMGEDGNLKYDHTKEPVSVENGNIVTYTLRIFNEGLMAGYASKVTDDVPDGLEFLPENTLNKEYRWTMYKLVGEKAEEEKTQTKEETDKTEDTITYGGKQYTKTEDAKEADIIVTDYLAKEQEKEAGDNLIQAFDKNKEISQEEPLNPDYRDIKVAFKVTEPNTSDRIVINTAEITDDRDPANDPVDDIDSIPGNNNEWNKEDDLDKEFVKVKYFDLALKKWVSKTIVIEDGKETVTETGHTGDEDPEPIVKVDLHRKKLTKVTVKFEFQIKVTNEGEIAGYAKEVTDYIPEGLKFIQEDNKQWYPREPLNGRERVGTKALADTLLQPGESANVPIILTWINGQDNIGLKTNIAEISEDYNDSHTPDIDSDPDNFKEGEDDIDDAPVMLSIELGQERVFFGLGFLILVTIAGGVILIKKFVL